MSALVMIVSAAAIIALVKYGLLRGIDLVAGALNWGEKARGQVTAMRRPFRSSCALSLRASPACGKPGCGTSPARTSSTRC